MVVQCVLRGVQDDGCGCGYVSISSVRIFDDGKMRLSELGIVMLSTCRKK